MRASLAGKLSDSSNWLAAVIQLDYRQQNDVIDSGNLIGLQQRGSSIIGSYYRHNWPHLLLEKTPCIL